MTTISSRSIRIFVGSFLVVLVLLIALVYLLPSAMSGTPLACVAGARYLPCSTNLTTDQIKAVGDARAAIVQLLTALVAASILAAGAYFTYQTLQLNRRGQVTERFAKSVELLGRDQQGAVDVCLGGLFALEQTARDEPSLASPIGEIITAYVRAHARLDTDQQAVTGLIQNQLDNPAIRLRYRKPDIQSALDILCMRPILTALRDRPLNLNAVDLSFAHFESSDLKRASMRGARLVGAWCVSARFDGARLDNTNLQFANLDSASLVEATLKGTDLRQSRNLARANLARSHADRTTLWPQDFDPNAAGVIVES